MGGAHPDEVVDEHGRRARALPRGDDQLLRTGGRGIPRRIQARDGRAPGAVRDQVAEPVALEVDAGDEVQRGVPLRAHEPAVDLDAVAALQAHRRHGALVALEVVDDAARLMRGRVEEAGLKLLVDAAELPIIEADHRGLKQVVLNLLSNAVKFTPEGGDIVVALSREDDDRIRLAVTDTGIGIAAEDLTRLARPFEQVEGQHSKTTQGTGLGLALTKSLIELHGGTLTLESEPGRGTRASFDLPIRRPHETAGREARAA